MKDILEKELKEIEGLFDGLESQRKDLINSINQLMTEQVRLQGDHRRVRKLLADVNGSEEAKVEEVKE